MTSQSTITQQPRQLSVNPGCLKRAPRLSEVPEPPADEKRFTSGPDQKFKMRLCELQCYLVLLGLSVVLCGRSADAQLGPDLDLRHHRLLQRAKAIGVATQDWTRKELEELLSALSVPDMEDRENDVSPAGANENLRMELERSVENTNALPPRERKSGCKNFYWKGFTSC
ncbi:somatostatin 1.2 [Triplophysa rosa]|uniref:Somatostatin-2 n=1 Tax=Triplophysa rosa TaxID=992332 RepID=A0A9W7TQR1_TRIRA|nr:somatostatin 1.2 [Triplophysa rosa]KAI7801164.1 preprosomatostatin 3 [Triplophysa rosa]